jgi:hypothetical protein
VLYYGHLEHALLFVVRPSQRRAGDFSRQTTARLPWEEATLQAQRGH